MTALAEPGAKKRIASIDIVGGRIMLLMAIYHTRDFFLNNTSPCRWHSKYKRSHSQWWLSYL
ncbi:MAG: hypothetical protein JSU01_08075 [Bacteroidetes bacterium]|nr:hypothetical protein [Bacteroidota bacterium]